LLQEVLHAYLGAIVAVCDVAGHVVWSQVKVGVVGTHDAGMLLRPRRLSRESKDFVVSGYLYDYYVAGDKKKLQEEMHL
jgi:hypothetical protein